MTKPAPGKRSRMRNHAAGNIEPRNGFGLWEVIVAFGCLLLLLMLLLPWLLSSRSSARQRQCLVRMRAIADGTLLYAENHAGDMPYLVDETGWPVMVVPYMKLPQAMRDEELLPKADLETLEMPAFICPDDPRSGERRGAMSYIMNGGFGRFPVDDKTGSVRETGTHTAGIDLDGDGMVSDAEWDINYATGVIWRPDARPDGFRMSLPWISDGDGMEFTLLASENLNAGGWLSEETMDLAFVIGRERLQFVEGEQSAGPLDLKSADLGPFAINANRGTLPGQSPAPSSLHGEFVHALYCDGHGGPLSANIDPIAYARLMTSNGSRHGEAGKPIP